jgi:N-acetylglucosaminyldiphosphoundecaprenol N-acetyl-beta-D-mannosaminyltransferase
MRAIIAATAERSVPISFMGYSLFSGDVNACADEITADLALGRQDCRIMACLNPHSFVVARDDDVFRSALQSADWLVPDGVGIIAAARFLGLPVKTRITGYDVLLAVMDRLNQHKGSVFFLGASDATLAKIRVRITNDYPNVVLAGTYSPPFKPEFTTYDNAAIIAAVNAVRPDVLWVGLTAPKQEKWLAANRVDLKVGAAGAIGAAFDFFGGTVKRSPKLFRIVGLEWLPRLLQQPSRLWRRTFVSAPVFLTEVYRDRQNRK